MLPSLELTQKMLAGYSAMCKELCKIWEIPQTSLDILLFLANNPEYTTARDIVQVRGIKANLVSIHVDRLVQDGYLTRGTIQGDRRKHALMLTEKANPVVAAGRQMQENYSRVIFCGVPQEQLDAFFSTLSAIGENIDKFLKGQS